MDAIEVEQLAKTYKVVRKKDEGVLSAVKGLFRREYKEVHAVRDISFSIAPGEMVAFLGPNGAGKTTTLKMLSGLIYPTSGTARVMGFIPWERSNEYRRNFALVMGQKNQLWWDLPARESFRLHREIYRIPKAAFDKVHDELIDLLRLGDLIGQPVRELSLGERMKMELVAALLHSPKVLFLDEPTIGLDVVAQTQLRQFLTRYNQDREVTVVLTSHYMKDVESLCERAIIINHGKLIYDGNLAGILAEFSHYKILKLQFAESVPEGISRYGDVLEIRGPVARLRVDRQTVAASLADILDRHAIEDVTVDEVPLEDVIAEVFQTGKPSETPATVT
ncbi:MAG: ABC transporter ATP-binding protein [Planctomycetota bacterium]